ncbi:MAG: sulfur carrier protein ThiS [Pseudomonadota bacterium]
MTTHADTHAITVLANGDPVRLAGDATVADLVQALRLAGRRFALECNGEIVPRSQHDQARLRDGDQIEIVHAVGGG